MKQAATSYTINVHLVVCYLSFCKTQFVPEHIKHERNCTTHLNSTQFFFTKLHPPCHAGQPERLKNSSGLIVILMSYMTSVVLLAGYSASLISSLAVERRNLPFTDLQGLLYDGSYRLGVMGNTSTINIFDVRSRYTSDYWLIELHNF
jgi:hypothetical protein